MRSDGINEIAAALAKAQGEIANATMDKINPHFKSRYSSLAAVRDAIQEPLAKNGIAYTQVTEIREGQMVLVTTLWHSSGQWIGSEYPLPVAGRPQELGSALTYARRYSLSAIVGNAADEDDDAEASEKQKQSVEQAPPRQSISQRAMPKGPTLVQDSRLRFMQECKTKIDAFGDEKALVAWWNSDDQKKARSDFELAQPDLDELKACVIARKEQLRKATELPITAAG